MHPPSLFPGGFRKRRKRPSHGGISRSSESAVTGSDRTYCSGHSGLPKRSQAACREMPKASAIVCQVSPLARAAATVSRMVARIDCLRS